MKNNYFKILLLTAALVLLNLASAHLYKRFDLTKDKRYTLSKPTKNILKNAKHLIHIKVYLQGNFPAEFKRLQIETKQHLKALKQLNNNIQFQFINPANITEELSKSGLEASRLQVQENGKYQEMLIFPWAIVSYQNKTENVPLLKDAFSNSQNQQLEASIQNLEYAFSNAIAKLTQKKSKKIAVLKGNGELNDIYIASFLKKLSAYYHLAPFTLDSVSTQAQKTLQQLNQYNLVIIAKPTQKFSEKEKYVLDQFIMNGGKTLWAVDQTQTELDSLAKNGEALAYPLNLGLTDFFFNYGLRINTHLISDLYSSKIPLATGNIGNKTQYNYFLWKYFPLLNSTNNHAINKNIAAVHLKFANTIDTLKNNIQKTILLQSSPLSKPIGTPYIVSLKNIGEKPNPKLFNKGNKPIAVLLEGNFKSAYNGRIKPFKIGNNKETGIQNKMAVIADGDIIANEIAQGKPLELGVDKWTNQKYGNADFLLNTVSYLLEDVGLINLRAKSIKINFLDKQKAFEQAKKWQIINLVFPLITMVIFGMFFAFYRKKKYR